MTPELHERLAARFQTVLNDIAIIAAGECATNRHKLTHHIHIYADALRYGIDKGFLGIAYRQGIDGENGIHFLTHPIANSKDFLAYTFPLSGCGSMSVRRQLKNLVMSWGGMTDAEAEAFIASHDFNSEHEWIV